LNEVYWQQVLERNIERRNDVGVRSVLHHLSRSEV
jgi:hypothetical protein